MAPRAASNLSERVRSPSPKASVRRRWGKNRRRLILLFASLVVSLVVLGAVEATLRLAGYGGYPPTFRAVGTLQDGSSLVFSDHGGPSSYFFANRSSPGNLDRSAMVMPKPAGTLRVMIIGESAAKGIPQPRGLAWSAFLKAMLSDLWPDRNVEVINLGTTAIASYPALGILTEALEQEPDVLVVWVGNNEFYGAFGVASLHSAGRTPGMIRAIRASRSLGISQFIDRQMAPKVESSSKTLMEAMIGRSSLGPADSARVAAARNLGVFTGEMVDRCREKGVPVVVCTPPANERDLAPLGEPDLSGLESAQRARIKELIDRAEVLVRSQDPAAEQPLREVLSIFADHPRAHFLMGRVLQEAGNTTDAAKMFQRAVDLDPMPWRPPSACVEAIRDAAEIGGAVVCDLRQAFRGASAGGSIGWELMDDHVHPSLRGQELAARTVAGLLAALPNLAAANGRAIGTLASDEEYEVRLGANPYEAYGVAYSMRLLAKIPFFRESNPGFLERTDTACQRFEAAASPEIMGQAKAWAEQPTRDGERRPISGMVGRGLMQLGRPAEAEPLFRLAAESVVPYGSWQLEYTYLWLKSREASNGGLDSADRQAARGAISRGQFLLSTGRSSTGAAELFVGQLHQLLGEFEESIPLLTAAREKFSDSTRAVADVALVESYMLTSRPDQARRIVAEGLRGRRELLPVYSELLSKLDGGAGGR